MCRIVTSLGQERALCTFVTLLTLTTAGQQLDRTVENRHIPRPGAGIIDFLHIVVMIDQRHQRDTTSKNCHHPGPSRLQSHINHIVDLIVGWINGTQLSTIVNAPPPGRLKDTFCTFMTLMTPRRQAHSAQHLSYKPQSERGTLCAKYSLFFHGRLGGGGCCTLLYTGKLVGRLLHTVVHQGS